MTRMLERWRPRRCRSSCRPATQHNSLTRLQPHPLRAACEEDSGLVFIRCMAAAAAAAAAPIQHASVPEFSELPCQTPGSYYYHARPATPLQTDARSAMSYGCPVATRNTRLFGHKPLGQNPALSTSQDRTPSRLELPLSNQ